MQPLVRIISWLSLVLILKSTPVAAFQALDGLYDFLGRGLPSDIGMLKFVVWLLFFAIFMLLAHYAKLGEVFDSARQGRHGRVYIAIIAAILSFMSTIAIPNELVHFIFLEWGAIASALLALSPVFITFFLVYLVNKAVQPHLWRKVIVGLLLIAMLIMLGSVRLNMRAAYPGDHWLISSIDVAQLLLVIALFFYIFTGGGSGNPAPSSPAQIRAHEPQTRMEAEEQADAAREEAHDVEEIEEDEKKEEKITVEQINEITKLLEGNMRELKDVERLAELYAHFSTLMNRKYFERIAAKAGPEHYEEFARQLEEVRTGLLSHLQRADHMVQQHSQRLERFARDEYSIIKDRTKVEQHLKHKLSVQGSTIPHELREYLVEHERMLKELTTDFDELTKMHETQKSVSEEIRRLVRDSNHAITTVVKALEHAANIKITRKLPNPLSHLRLGSRSKTNIASKITSLKQESDRVIGLIRSDASLLLAQMDPSKRPNDIHSAAWFINKEHPRIEKLREDARALAAQIHTQLLANAQVNRELHTLTEEINEAADHLRNEIDQFVNAYNNQHTQVRGGSVTPANAHSHLNAEFQNFDQKLANTGQRIRDRLDEHRVKLESAIGKLTIDYRQIIQLGAHAERQFGELKGRADRIAEDIHRVINREEHLKNLEQNRKLKLAHDYALAATTLRRLQRLSQAMRSH